ncbi:ABC transporter permease [Corynebacterium pyruviciproducens]|uniref:ABC transporter permease n=1 Tax=Corynebacterium pyruviciproducens TaxID=598660 RepID=A0AAF1BWS6_9CORY|nr:ABC transporter permease [Corynebacterium pyruviciproducens]MDH4658595.1 ABC transporter permease [Corynebacterium pyruviciproducens]WOT02181.1 ABC transporter permease [Corynebacterium pyruviciproducens]
MGRLIAHNIRLLLRNRGLVFWTLAFPILLGVLFKAALGGLMTTQSFDPVPVAVVDSQEYRLSPYKTAFDELSRGDDALVTVTSVATTAEGSSLLVDDHVAGVVEVIGDEASLTVATGGMDQTILTLLLDEIAQRVDMVTTLMADEMAPGEDPQAVAAEIMDRLAESGFTLKDASPSSMDPLMAEFFSLVAMAALYGGMFSGTLLNYAQPQLGTVGRRIGVAPTRKSVFVASGIIASYVVEFVGLVLLVVVCRFLFGIDFGSNWGLTLVVASAGALAGLSLGVAVSALVRGGENMKIGVLIGMTMLGALLAGMMGGGLRYRVDATAPLVNKVNPVALITDGFYTLYYHPGSDGLWADLGILLVISLVLIGASMLTLRRQRYDSM